MWTGCEAYFDNLDRLPRQEVAGESEPVDEMPTRKDGTLLGPQHTASKQELSLTSFVPRPCRFDKEETVSTTVLLPFLTHLYLPSYLCCRLSTPPPTDNSSPLNTPLPQRASPSRVSS